jgi:hypothetical protein
MSVIIRQLNLFYAFSNFKLNSCDHPKGFWGFGAPKPQNPYQKLELLVIEIVIESEKMVDAED